MFFIIVVVMLFFFWFFFRACFSVFVETPVWVDTRPHCTFHLTPNTCRVRGIARLPPQSMHLPSQFEAPSLLNMPSSLRLALLPGAVMDDCRLGLQNQLCVSHLNCGIPSKSIISIEIHHKCWTPTSGTSV